MIGLQYICQIKGITYEELGKMMGISRQAVNTWFSKNRNVPEKHLSFLENKFKISRELLVKTIDSMDKVTILNNEISLLLIT